jgi:hypothetical protein
MRDPVATRLRRQRSSKSGKIEKRFERGVGAGVSARTAGVSFRVLSMHLPVLQIFLRKAVVSQDEKVFGVLSCFIFVFRAVAFFCVSRTDQEEVRAYFRPLSER